MPPSRLKFTYGATDTARIPDAFVEAASLLSHLEGSGLVATMGDKLRIRRQGGFPALDIALMLLVYFSSGLRRGLRLVWEESLGGCGRQLAALAGRDRLPSPPALSRTVDAVETDLIRPGIGWLLGAADLPAAAWPAEDCVWHYFGRTAEENPSGDPPAAARTVTTERAATAPSASSAASTSR